MSLISLLIALAVERYLPSANWQFSTFYRYYSKLIKLDKINTSQSNEKIISAIFIVVPALLCYSLLTLVDSDFFTFIVSTLVLIVCLGCSQTRDSYRQYLKAAFRGELKDCGKSHKALAASKNIEGLGFGQMLIWLNYRYFIAIMFVFVLFGAPGAILYRLLVTVNETSPSNDGDELTVEESIKEPRHEDNEQTHINDSTDEHKQSEFNTVNDDDLNNAQVKNHISGINVLIVEQSKELLDFIDWLLIRVVAFGYMLVGHFSRALPTWLDYVFNAKKPAYQLLIDVAEKSEDVLIDEDDCTAEPCVLVRLAKRTLLLCLVVLSLLIVTGVIS